MVTGIFGRRILFGFFLGFLACYLALYFNLLPAISQCDEKTLCVAASLMGCNCQSKTAVRVREISLTNYNNNNNNNKRSKEIQQLEHVNYQSHIDIERSLHKDSTVADILARSVRVMCLVLTTKKYHRARAVYVKETWGRRCDKLIFASDTDDKELGAIKMQNDTRWIAVWGKTKSMFKLAHDKYLNDFDWFLKADDDSYIVMENLRLVLSQFPPNEPIMLGRQRLDFLPGGGYVLSRKALQKLVTESYPNPHICYEDFEDQAMCRCLRNVGVMVADSRDHRQKQRFFLDPPDVQINLYRPEDELDLYPFITGPSAISETVVLFHHFEDARVMKTIDVLLYNIKVFGLAVSYSATASQIKQVLQERGYRIMGNAKQQSAPLHAIQWPELPKLNLTKKARGKNRWKLSYPKPSL